MLISKTCLFFLFQVIIIFSVHGQIIQKIDTTSHGYYIDESTPLPFSPVLSLEVGIQDSSFVVVEVHVVNNDLTKETLIKSSPVRKIVSQHLPKGRFLINWDGLDDSDNKLSDEMKYIYFLKIYRSTETLYGRGYVKLEAKTKITFPPK